jgi:glutamate synthase domain-containing protein 2
VSLLKRTNTNKHLSLAEALGIGAAATLLGGAGAVWLGRYTIKKTVNDILKIFMTDKYDENLWEFVSAATRAGLQNIIENNLRSERGKIIFRPLGTPKKFLHFDDLMFDIAQLNTMPTEANVKIETKTVIGPMAKKPLVLDIPIMVSGMAHGTALSEKVKIAIAKGTAMIGTATNTGEGGMLPSERKVARYLVLQFPRAKWVRDEKTLKQADMIEIQFGQGAQAGTSHSKTKLGKKARQIRGLKKGETAVIEARLPEMKQGYSLKQIVNRLREITGGVPIGVKFGCGKYLEKDMEIALKAEVDVIALDGAQAATKGAPPIIEDDFGLPTLHALCRAVRFLEKEGVRDKVSLIISGGLLNPGHFLKAIALGANAISIGTTILFAVAHKQVLQAMPFETPTQITWDDGKFSKQFNINKGAQTVYNFLQSSILEMEDGVRALGKTSIWDVTKDDLMALTPEVAQITGVDLAY